MAEVCTPFWTAHVQTKELDFCEEVNLSLASVAPIPTSKSLDNNLFIKTLLIQVNSISGKSSSFTESIPADGIIENFFWSTADQFYIKSANQSSTVFGDQTGKIVSSATGPLEFNIEALSGTDVEGNTITPDFSTERNFALFVESNDASKYSDVVRGTEKVVIECLVEQGSVSFVNWVTLYKAVSIIKEVENFDTGNTDNTQTTFLFNTQTEVDDFIANTTKTLAGWQSDVFVSMYPFYEGDTSDNPDFAAPIPHFSPISSNENFNPRNHSFDSSVTPKPDRNYKSVSAFGAGDIKITPLRYLSVPYIVSELAFESGFVSNVAGNLTTQNPTVLSNDASDVQLGVAQVTTGTSGGGGGGSII